MLSSQLDRGQKCHTFDMQQHLALDDMFSSLIERPSFDFG